MARTSSSAVAELDSAIRAWGDATEDISTKATASMKRLIADIEAEVHARSRRVRAVEAEIGAARGEARARLVRELGVTTTALERGRRGLRQAKDAERRMQVLQKRVNEATASRVPRASQSLKRKLRALSDYASVPSPSGKITAETGNAAGGSPSRAQMYSRLVPMVLRAAGTELLDAVAQTGDQATTHLPERLQDPASVGLAAFHELRSGWDVYSRTPEMLAARTRNLLERK